MKARDELLEVNFFQLKDFANYIFKQLKRECAAKLSQISQGAQYSNLLKQLIVQGLIKIEESVVEIQCRAEDKSKVNAVVSWFY